MKNKGILTVLAISALVSTSGCAVRGQSGSGRGVWAKMSSVATPPLLTVVLTNNTLLPIEVFENGQQVSFRDTAGNFHPAIIPSGNTVSRGYYNFLGRRDIVITVRGICPPTPVDSDKKAAGCTPGQYAGTASRRFSINTDGQYHADDWEINNLRGPRGVN